MSETLSFFLKVSIAINILNVKYAKDMCKQGLVTDIIFFQINYINVLLFCILFFQEVTDYLLCAKNIIESDICRKFNNMINTKIIRVLFNEIYYMCMFYNR